MASKNTENSTPANETIRERTDRLIKEYGYTVIFVFAGESDEDSAPFAYTVGLTEKGHPEMIVFGMPHTTAHRLISLAVEQLLEDKLVIGEPVSEIATCDMIFQHVEPSRAADYIYQANDRAKRDLPAIQMVWPDRNGKFPWDADFEKEFEGKQIMLFEPEKLRFRLN